MLHIWAICSDNLSLFNDLQQTEHHTWCSQQQQLCRIWWALSQRLNFSTWSVPGMPLTPSFVSSKTFSLWKAAPVPLLVSFHPTLCLFLLTSLTHSSKWAWHASHCLTKVCVWAVFREVRPSLGHTNQLQTTAQAGRHWTGEWNHSLHPLVAPQSEGQISSILYSPVTPSTWCPQSPGFHPWLLVPSWGPPRGKPVSSCYTKGASWMWRLPASCVLTFSFN